MKASPTIVVRFGVVGKLPHYIGPYKNLERVGSLAYKLALPSNVDGVHMVFHVSMVRSTCEIKTTLFQSFNTWNYNRTHHIWKNQLKSLTGEKRSYEQRQSCKWKYFGTIIKLKRPLERKKMIWKKSIPIFLLKGGQNDPHFFL